LSTRKVNDYIFDTHIKLAETTINTYMDNMLQKLMKCLLGVVIA